MAGFFMEFPSKIPAPYRGEVNDFLKIWLLLNKLNFNVNFIIIHNPKYIPIK